ncbi:MAG: guanylate kinase [Bdellovibrio sp.]
MKTPKLWRTPLITVAAPSGGGKSSFVDRICREDQRLKDIVTCTTRSPRAGEEQGKGYFFMSTKEFDRRLQNGEFVESAHVHNHLYGTLRDTLEQAWAEGCCAIMDVDVQGVATFKKCFPESKSIFILPPSIDELRRRVLSREGKAPSDLELRLRTAARELELAPQFDAQVLNDDFESGFKRFQKIVDQWLEPL